MHSCLTSGPEVHPETIYIQLLRRAQGVTGFYPWLKEPAHLLIRDGDVLALEWKDVSQMSNWAYRRGFHD